MHEATNEVVVFGIDTCDQTRKARAWLRAHAIEHRFHDFRRGGLAAQQLANWLGRVPWDSLLNRRGLAWRKLDAPRRASVTDQASAAELMLADPLLIKRPVLQAQDRIVVGFSDVLYAGVFATPERGDVDPDPDRAGGERADEPRSADEPKSDGADNGAARR